MTPSFKRGGGRKLIIVTKSIARNYFTRARFYAGNKHSDIGATHRALSPDESVDYIRRVFADYLEFAGLDPSRLADQHILELGPGDNCGVAMLFLDSGASQVVCLDKFLSRHDALHQARIYQALTGTFKPERRERLHRFARIDCIPPEFDPEHLKIIHGHGIEEAGRLLPSGHFDLIVSRAVLEEVFPIEEAFESMHILLRPGGMLIHKVDLSDYGLLSSRGYHPLEFLTIPEALYARMCTDSGLPNRRRIGYYGNLLSRRGYEFTLHVTRALGFEEEFGPGRTADDLPRLCKDRGHAMIEQIRTRLDSRFRSLPEEDLLALGMFLVARKPRG